MYHPFNVSLNRSLTLAVLSAALLVAPAAFAQVADQLIYTPGRYLSSSGGKVEAVVVENRFFSATLVPELGGRILELIDKSSGKNLVYERGYGGLLDDHGARVVQPYQLTWIKQTATEGIAELLLDEEVVYRKTITFRADMPCIQVDYHCENRGQSDNRMLFRNVVRPGGCTFSDQELYCSSRTNGLVRGSDLPYRDTVADPWAALVHPGQQTIVANFFEGDALDRLYSWRKGVVAVAPTYEFTFPPLLPGHQIAFRYYWILGHGLTAVDYAHRNFIAQIEGALANGKLKLNLDLLATWQPMPTLSIEGQVLDASRQPIATLPTTQVPLTELDRVTSTPLVCEVPTVDSHVILLLTLKDPSLPEPIVIEKTFASAADGILTAAYVRPTRFLGDKVVQEPIPGWAKETDYTVQADDADRKRGYLVFEESGEQAGCHTASIAFDLAQNEPEGFPLHFQSVGFDGQVDFTVQAPDGFTLESFVPEHVPETFWTGEIRHGLKLLSGNAFTVTKDEDKTLFFRLTAGTPPPGIYQASIVFQPAHAPASTVTLNITVYPIRFPDQPLMVFDANNSVNALASRPGKTTQSPEWDQERSDNFFQDMRTHGIRGHNMSGGVNTPFAHYWYDRVKVRESGLTLTEAIKQNPERFRDRLDLPELDFSEWDWFSDQFLRAGMTHFRVQMGACGDGFMSKHSNLTRLIYGAAQPPASYRQAIIREWYEGAAVRYFKDRGILRVFAIIDDEIPSERLAWWVQHAFRSIQMGFEPGVTLAASTIADDQLMSIVGPFMKYWVIGSMNKPTMDLRFAENSFKPEHRVVTYHSSANHWQKYDQMRGRCGLDTAFYNLDACWIQTYDRFYSQIQSVVYPGEKGPISSAAWEGARDGLDDGNYLLLARALAAALPEPERTTEQAKIERIVGMSEDSLIQFYERPSDHGMVTLMGRHQGKAFRPYRTCDFREAKRQLLHKVVELSTQAPVQKASAWLGLHPIVRDGQPVFKVPAGIAQADRAAAFIVKAVADQHLALVAPTPEPVDLENPYPVFFMGSLDELSKKIPLLRNHPNLADLDEHYPSPGNYVIRFLPRLEMLKNGVVKTDASTESMVILSGDETGLDRAEANLIKVVTQSKTQYSHWLLTHRK